MEDLFANEAALALVEGICKVGYLTHETPVVIKRDGKYVMVEGNRRLAALKAIQNPMMVPAFHTRIAGFASLLPDRTALSEIRVMIAPSQAEVDQLIAAIHTGNMRRPWSPARQAAFFQAQIDAGRTLKELVGRYPTIDVRKFVFRAHIINLFKSVDYEDAELKDFVATKQWAKGLSTLARIYESKDFLTLTGLSMDDEGKITKTIPDGTFREIAGVIVEGISERTFDTRRLNSVKSPVYTQLMAELRRVVEDADSPPDREEVLPKGEDERAGAGGQTPSTSRTGAEDGAASAPGGVMSATGTVPSSSLGRTKKSRNLDLSQIQVPDSYPEAMKLLLGELATIDVQRHANATFLLMRAVLERSIKAFAEAKAVDIRDTGNNENGRVQLGHALNWLLTHVRANGPTHLRQVIEEVRTGKLVAYTNTKDSLDAVNHNHHFKVDPDQAVSMWRSIDSIMRYLMKP